MPVIVAAAGELGHAPSFRRSVADANDQDVVGEDRARLHRLVGVEKSVCDARLIRFPR